MRGIIRSRFWKRVYTGIFVVVMVVAIIGLVVPTPTVTATVETFSSATSSSWTAPAGVISVQIEYRLPKQFG